MYTKGPWTTEVYEELRLDGTRWPATYIEATKGWAKGKRTVAIVGHWRDRPNPEDDSRLIAAAPELLEALEHCLISLRALGGKSKDSQKWADTGYDDMSIKMAEKVLRKAKGE